MEDIFNGGKLGETLTTHHHLVPIRLEEAIQYECLPSPHVFKARRLIKKRENFNILLDIF
jgi:hypothetical protein